MKKILLPIEQNIAEREIIDEVVKIAKMFNSSVVIFNADNSKHIISKLDTEGFIDKDNLLDTVKRSSPLEEIKKMYEVYGIKVEIIIKESDDPAAAIIDEAKNGKYDLLIMKTHVLKKRSRFTLGSVTNKVVHHVCIPILIIR